MRANLFANGADLWQLREWRTDLNPDGSPYFRAEPVKDTPQIEFFSNLDVPAGGRMEDLRKQFLGELRTVTAARLLQPEKAKDAGKVSDTVDFIALVGADFGNKFTDFQSNEPFDDSENPAKQSDQLARDALTAGLGAQNVATKPSVDELLTRAGAVTCGGCHHFSSGKPISGTGTPTEIKWPESLSDPSFLHINEAGELSPALKDNFLVSRCRNLNAFLSSPLAFAPVAPQSAPPEPSVDNVLTQLQSGAAPAAKLSSLSTFSATVEKRCEAARKVSRARSRPCAGSIET